MEGDRRSPNTIDVALVRCEHTAAHLTPPNLANLAQPFAVNSSISKPGALDSYPFHQLPEMDKHQPLIPDDVQAAPGGKDQDGRTVHDVRAANPPSQSIALRVIKGFGVAFVICALARAAILGVSPIPFGFGRSDSGLVSTRLELQTFKRAHHVTC